MTTLDIGQPLSILKDRVFCGIPVLLDSSASDTTSPFISIFRVLMRLPGLIASLTGIPRSNLYLKVSSLIPHLLATSDKQSRSPSKSIFQDVERWLCCSRRDAHLQFSLKYPRDESIRSIDSQSSAKPMSSRKFLKSFHLSQTAIPAPPYALYAFELGFRHLCNMLFHVRYSLLRVCFVLPPWPCFVAFAVAPHDLEQYFPRPSASFDGYVKNVAPQTGHVLHIGIAGSLLSSTLKVTEIYVRGKLAEKEVAP